MNDLQHRAPRDPRRVQGGDLTDLPEGTITLNLGLCTNRLGPPPAAVEALQDFLEHHADRLMPPPYESSHPPYRAHRRYLQAFAHRLGEEVEVDDMLAGRGVSEFLLVLARLLSLSSVAVITPDYTETMDRFAYADFVGPDSGMQDTAEDRARRLYLAMRTHDYVVLSNPSNPLGHFIPREQVLQACLDNPGCTLVLDEEYIAFQGQSESLAGAPVRNLVVLQSTGKAYGLTAPRAGMLWTRNTRLREKAGEQIPTWPLSLLDIVVATAALEDRSWLAWALLNIDVDARRMQKMLTDHFGGGVVPADIHYRFVHLENPYPVLEHLKSHGISVRLFTSKDRGCVSGLRLMTPSSGAEFQQLSHALRTL